MIERWQISYFPFVILFITFFLYCRMWERKPKYFTNLADTFLNRQMFQHKSIADFFNSISSIYMMINFVLMLALTLSYFVNGKDFEILHFFKILFIEIAFIFFYLLFFRFFTFTFIKNMHQSEFLRISLLYYEVAGIVLFISNIALYYLPFHLSFVIVGLLVLFLLFKQLKSYSLLSQQFSIFHNILYFCAIENLPLLLQIKVVLKRYLE